MPEIISILHDQLIDRLVNTGVPKIMRKYRIVLGKDK